MEKYQRIITGFFVKLPAPGSMVEIMGNIHEVVSHKLINKDGTVDYIPMIAIDQHNHIHIVYDGDFLVVCEVTGMILEVLCPFYFEEGIFTKME